MESPLVTVTVSPTFTFMSAGLYWKSLMLMVLPAPCAPAGAWETTPTAVNAIPRTATSAIVSLVRVRMASVIPGSAPRATVAVPDRAQSGQCGEGVRGSAPPIVASVQGERRGGDEIDVAAGRLERQGADHRRPDGPEVAAGGAGVDQGVGEGEGVEGAPEPGDQPREVVAVDGQHRERVPVDQS